MRRLFIPGILLLAACATQPSGDFQAGDAETAIKRHNAAFGAAVKAGSASDLEALYGDTAVLLPPNMPATRGRAAIGQFWGGMLATGAATLELTADDVMQQGDLAVETGRYALVLTPKGATTNVNDNGKYIVVWRKIGGDWKIVRDIYSSDLPAPAAH
jgi:ketosteroid isomerase-like protein